MKKYIKPTVKVRVIEMESLLAAGSITTSSYSSENGYTIDVNNTEGNGAAGAKKSLFDNRWDGEE